MRTEAEGVAAIERWFRKALAAVDPVRAVTAHLEMNPGWLRVDGRRVPIEGRLFVIAVGKAAAGMASGAALVCGDAIAAGIALTNDGHLANSTPREFESFEAAHPIPDARGVAATDRILSVVTSAGPGDVVLVLLSGGGSALLEAPRDGVTLSDIATTTELLLRSGAPIQHLNAVRIPLSRVKGGGLRAAAPDARFVTLLLSDVLGNDPRVIASGPTVPSAFTGANALSLLETYSVLDRAPPAVVVALRVAANEDGFAAYEDDVVAVVGDNATAVNAFVSAAEEEAVPARVTWSAKEGEARALASEWVAACLASDLNVNLLLGGGEATVAVRGEGIGGRNTEFTLAAALELERLGNRDWIVASLATDGQDGPTGAAGAIATPSTLDRARATGLDPASCLDRNDSFRLFERVGGAAITGPTGTNVNDIYVALRIG